MKTYHLSITAIISVAVLDVHGDVLELKNGKTLNGKCGGGTASTVPQVPANGGKDHKTP